DVEYKQRVPGTIATRAVRTAIAAGGENDGVAPAAEVLRLVKARTWAESDAKLPIGKGIPFGRFSDRGSRTIFSPLAAPNEADAMPRICFAQSGVLRFAGRYQLPGARVWGWYDAGIDVSGPADLVQVSDDKDASLDPPDAGLPEQNWLVNTWA